MFIQYLQNSFFPYCLKQWDELDDKIQNSPSVFSLKKSLLQFIRPSPCSIFGVHNPSGVTLLTRLRVGLSHLRAHKFITIFLILKILLAPFVTTNLNALNITCYTAPISPFNVLSSLAASLILVSLSCHCLLQYSYKFSYMEIVTFVTITTLKSYLVP